MVIHLGTTIGDCACLCRSPASQHWTPYKGCHHGHTFMECSLQEGARRSCPGRPHLFFIYCFFESCCVSTAARGLSLVTASGRRSLVVVCRPLLWGLLLPQNMVSRESRLQSLWHTGFVAQQHMGSSRQGLNPCLLHWQEDSLPPSHQGSPLVSHVNCKIPKFLIYSLNIVILKYICKGVNFFITLYQKQVNQLSVNRGRIK